MCRLLEVSRSLVYYHLNKEESDALDEKSKIEKALLRCNCPLKDIKVFHSDRGKEYDNIKTDNILEIFNIERSLSRKGNPYDKAVSEAMNKILKIEFIYQNKFNTLEELELQLAESIYWYNHIRIHGSIRYITPIVFVNRKLYHIIIENCTT